MLKILCKKCQSIKMKLASTSTQNQYMGKMHNTCIFNHHESDHNMMRMSKIFILSILSTMIFMMNSAHI
ncbi:hypothetical protein DD594_26580 [Enterobacter cloacae complex sp. 4DZ1-17B1]|nr:hypothetical protein DD594_26580 [Enterobacter cloacae complex sp. 4DZ1-17B1]